MKVFWIFLSFLAITQGELIHNKDDYDERMHPVLKFNKIRNVAELDSDYWIKNAKTVVKEKLKQKANTNIAKNVILFLGDGMSVHTITATRSFMGGENKKLSFEKFPYYGLTKTYCVNGQVPDSACTASAILSGVKTNMGVIGVNAQVKRRDCEAAADPKKRTESFTKWAQDACKATGIVTTARITHATPASAYAHSAERNWENNDDMEGDRCNPRQQLDIAQQLIHGPIGKNLKVALGGGRSEFLDDTIIDNDGIRGYRTDNRNLIKEWQDFKKPNENRTYVSNRKELRSINELSTDYLLGLFSADHLPFHGDIVREKLTNVQPTLTEMTEIALKLLQKEEKGYFLFVEGARIDMAHHATKARKALEDTQEFANAIQKAVTMTSEEDTLIIVTSDHSHTMTINGYQDRESDILGLAGKNGDDNLPYTTLSYANGLGYLTAYKEGGGGRRDISEDDFTDPDYQYMATVPLASETHGGEDVGVYALGPNAKLFMGNYEQNHLAILMAKAAEIGTYYTGTGRCSSASSLIASISISSFILIALLISKM